MPRCFSCVTEEYREQLSILAIEGFGNLAGWNVLTATSPGSWTSFQTIPATI